MSVSRTATDGRRTGRMMATAVMGWLVVAALAGVAAAQDQTAAPVPVLTLDECIRQALAGSPTLQISAQQREIAAQNVRGAKGAFLPNLSLSYNWQKSERTDFDVAQSQAGTYSIPTTDPGISVLFPTQVPSGEIADETVSATYKSLGGRATLNVFDGFAKYGNLRSAKHSLGAADATVGYTRERVVEDVVAAYYNLVRYEKLAEVAREAQEQAARELERTETYFRLGSAAKSDVLQQRVQLGNTKLDVVVAENSIKKGQADLAYAMNLPLQGSFNVDPTVLETDFAVADVTELYGEALRNRLDLQSSELALEARRQDVKTARGSLFPQLDVYGNYGRDNNESPFKFGAQISSSTSYGYSVSWNIFDRLQTYSGISRAKASARIAEYQLEQARLNAQVEIRQLHNALVEARERADVSRETIVQAEEGLRLAQERFRVGAGTALDVIVAQVNLTTARAQEVQAKVDFLIARSSLDRALGRRNAGTES
ncbi:MAG: TolC family protein [bacterium]|nr:TolC family protein [bacterium]